MFENFTDDAVFEDEQYALLQKNLSVPVVANPAVLRCRNAMNEVAQDMMEEMGLPIPGKEPEQNGESKESQIPTAELRSMAKAALKDAHRAYREAMPPLIGAQNIRDFIACVTHGLLIEIFTPNESSRLLYAAQIAAMAESRRQKTKAN